MKNKLRSILVICVLTTSCEKASPPQDQKTSSSVPEVESQNFQKCAYLDIRNGNSITLISSHECEIKDGRDILLGNYSTDGSKLRVTFKQLGADHVTYYNIEHNGLRGVESGTLYSDPGAVRLALDERRQQAEREIKEKENAEQMLRNSEISTQTLSEYDLSGVGMVLDDTGIHDINPNPNQATKLIIKDSEVTLKWTPDPRNLSRTIKYRKLFYCRGGKGGLDLRWYKDSSFNDDETADPKFGDTAKSMDCYLDLVKAVKQWKSKYPMVRQPDVTGLDD